MSYAKNINGTLTMLTLLAIGAGCGSEAQRREGEELDRVSTVSTVVDLELADGDMAQVEVLPGSSWQSPGDRDYLLKVGARELWLSGVSAEDESGYLELGEGTTSLAMVEFNSEYVALRSPEGGSLYSWIGELPEKDSLQLVDSLSLAIVEAEGLAQIDEAVIGEPSLPGSTFGKATKALQINKIAVTAGASCTKNGSKCVCKVGQRCTTHGPSCDCEPTTANPTAEAFDNSINNFVSSTRYNAVQYHAN